jgi:hypothetical protein
MEKIISHQAMPDMLRREAVTVIFVLLFKLRASVPRIKRQ